MYYETLHVGYAGYHDYVVHLWHSSCRLSTHKYETVPKNGKDTSRENLCRV